MRIDITSSFTINGPESPRHSWTLLANAVERRFLSSCRTTTRVARLWTGLESRFIRGLVGATLVVARQDRSMLLSFGIPTVIRQQSLHAGESQYSS